MNWLLENAEAIRLIATLFGLLAAGLGFWRYFEQRRQQDQEEAKAREEERQARVEEREHLRTMEVEAWREVAAYKYFCEMGRPISRQELLTALRDFSFEDKSIDIRKEELSTEAIERLIISMLSKQLIDSFDGDNFIVSIMSFEKLEQRAFIPPFPTQSGITLQKVRENPGEYTEIALRQMCEFENRPVQFRALLQDLINRGFVAFGPNGTIYPIHEDAWAASFFDDASGHDGGRNNAPVTENAAELEGVRTAGRAVEGESNG